MGTLLTFDPAMLPLLCALKLAAALVLLPVSAARVVLGVNEVAAHASQQDERGIKSASGNRYKW
jgi:hypothetical protein